MAGVMFSRFASCYCSGIVMVESTATRTAVTIALGIALGMPVGIADDNAELVSSSMM